MLPPASSLNRPTRMGDRHLDKMLRRRTHNFPYAMPFDIHTFRNTQGKSNLSAGCSGTSKATEARHEEVQAITTTVLAFATQRKNILKAAFAGQLIPQNPNDEPASALLERIRAERVASSAKRPVKNGRKPKEKA